MSKKSYEERYKAKCEAVYGVKLATRKDVKTLRKLYKLTQTEFSWILGIGVRRVQGWESGEFIPDGPATFWIMSFLLANKGDPDGTMTVRWLLNYANPGMLKILRGRGVKI